jgi:hypothetical protein
MTTAHLPSPHPCSRCGATHHAAMPCPPDAPMTRFLAVWRLSPYAADLSEKDYLKLYLSERQG